MSDKDQVNNQIPQNTSFSDANLQQLEQSLSQLHTISPIGMNKRRYELDDSVMPAIQEQLRPRSKGHENDKPYTITFLEKPFNKMVISKNDISQINKNNLSFLDQSTKIDSDSTFISGSFNLGGNSTHQLNPIDKNQSHRISQENLRLNQQHHQQSIIPDIQEDEDIIDYIFRKSLWKQKTQLDYDKDACDEEFYEGENLDQEAAIQQAINRDLYYQPHPEIHLDTYVDVYDHQEYMDLLYKESEELREKIFTDQFMTECFSHINIPEDVFISNLSSYENENHQLNANV